MYGQAVAQTIEPTNNIAPIGAENLDKKRGRFNNVRQVAHAIASQIFDNNEILILTADELACRLRVKPSWVVDHSSRAKTSDPIPVLRLGRLRRYRWNSPEMIAWLDRRAGISSRVGR